MYEKTYPLASGALVCELPWCDPEAICAALADQHGTIWFDSCDPSHTLNRSSYICTAPYQSITAKNERAPFARLAELLPDEKDIWDGLPENLPPFRGGLAGVFGYDLGRGLEALPPHAPPYAIDALGLPDLALGLYGDCLAFDHAHNRLFIFASGLPAATPAERRRVAARHCADWHDRLRALRPLPEPTASPPLEIRANMTRNEFETRVNRLIAHILKGDIFQANLAQCFTTELATDDDAFAFYRRLRRSNPAPFACFARFEDFALASTSPERFLKIENGRVETRPIKGTAPRYSDHSTDQKSAAVLALNEKERAENIMIVDLMRNDLARICCDHSVKVTQICGVENFANMHHLVSIVEGALREDCTAIDALRACFPGGSITGAPKIRAQELIATYEPHTRGPYCGSIAMLGFDGYMDTNIAIRTAIIKGQTLHYHAGAAITADSNAAAEYEETHIKARGFFKSLEDISAIAAQ